LDLPDNVLVITDKDFYELMMYVDYHSTVYSTCALEAPSFGVQNIMINIKNLSRKYFETSLIDRTTKYADAPEEYLNLIRSMDKLDKKTVYYLNEGVIMPNYRKNLGDAISQILVT
jgi:superfamily I DNA and RNA helicase